MALPPSARPWGNSSSWLVAPMRTSSSHEPSKPGASSSSPTRLPSSSSSSPRLPPHNRPRPKPGPPVPDRAPLHCNPLLLGTPPSPSSAPRRPKHASSTFPLDRLIGYPSAHSNRAERSATFSPVAGV